MGGARQGGGGGANDDAESVRLANLYRAFRREVWIMSLLTHVNIVQMLGFTKNWLIMEFVEHGDLVRASELSTKINCYYYCYCYYFLKTKKKQKQNKPKIYTLLLVHVVEWRRREQRVAERLVDAAAQRVHVQCSDAQRREREQCIASRRAAFVDGSSTDRIGCCTWHGIPARALATALASRLEVA